MTTSETVTISREEYQDLLEFSNWLDALNDAGVDNWDGIEYAREIYIGRYAKEGDDE
jgi:hypothetical protein